MVKAHKSPQLKTDGESIKSIKDQQARALASAHQAGTRFDVSELLALARSQYCKTLPGCFDGQPEGEFDAFFNQAVEAFERGFKTAREDEAAALEVMTSVDEATETVGGMLRELTGLFGAISRLERQAHAGHRDFEISALASIGEGICENARGILGAASVDDFVAQTHQARERDHEHA